jgi:hypothetical protein
MRGNERGLKERQEAISLLAEAKEEETVDLRLYPLMASGIIPFLCLQALSGCRVATQLLLLVYLSLSLSLIACYLFTAQILRTPSTTLN